MLGGVVRSRTAAPQPSWSSQNTRLALAHLLGPLLDYAICQVGPAFQNLLFHAIRHLCPQLSADRSSMVHGAEHL